MILSELPTRELLDQLTGRGLWLRTGPFLFCVRTNVGGVIENLRQVYADFPVLPPQSFADYHVSIFPQRGLRRWLSPAATFSLDGVFSYDPFPLHMAPAFFEWGLNSCISRNVHHRLTLHGAVVERGDRAVIILGNSGAGKSTLCAALVADGWRLLSDELTLIDPESLQISALARPISLKNESVSILRQRWPSAVFGPSSHGPRKGTIVHLRPPRSSVLRMHETAEASAVLFVNFEAGTAAPRWNLVPPAEAHLRIARQSFNYGILGAQGFETLTRLLERAAVYDFSYGDLDHALDVLASDELFG